MQFAKGNSMSLFSHRAALVGLICVVGLTACGDSPAQRNTANPSNPAPTVAHVDAILLDVYKSETCGCCGEWIAHADERGFQSTSHHPADLGEVKARLGISPRYQSCHTAVTKDGYVFEGHIPAKLIHQFLAEKPAGAIGLAVPGMPLGSPGMEVGDRFTPYDVLLLKEDGSSEVYAHINQASVQY